MRPRYLFQDERIKIADLRRCGLSIRAIADEFRRAPSTVSRESRRNAEADSGYQRFVARRQANARRARPHRRRLGINRQARRRSRRIARSALESAAE
ncbi:helix-turn-helix domain-containing protein [Mycolicibacterium sp. BiH015]|uniref:helix-turn-helix domain-containing protein n=1 Tax=Mycolicibacterium sp. BiH015 TaxID=3018808 RepID=UPI0022E031F9|nr:helix-turn-helix domain-containing protein [Mycolicibacterium sp. BiH015]MDA2893304.1 helix-turn-helix domain-containing protein [Mycolicibacterium sp. BiH015]